MINIYTSIGKFSIGIELETHATTSMYMPLIYIRPRLGILLSFSLEYFLVNLLDMALEATCISRSGLFRITAQTRDSCSCKYENPHTGFHTELGTIRYKDLLDAINTELTRLSHDWREDVFSTRKRHDWGGPYL